MPGFKLDSGHLLAVGLCKTLSLSVPVLPSLNGDSEIEHLVNAIMITNSSKISLKVGIKISGDWGGLDWDNTC